MAGNRSCVKGGVESSHCFDMAGNRSCVKCGVDSSTVSIWLETGVVSRKEFAQFMNWAKNSLVHELDEFLPGSKLTLFFPRRGQASEQTPTLLSTGLKVHSVPFDDTRSDLSHHT
ncbi:unnamed protein product, partial [Timema podura]|nr:unnamed protein product [Timema podura]